MPSSHLILCCPLLLLPPIPPNIRVFSNESTLRMRGPKYWSFSFSIIPSKETPGLISFRMDWLDLLAVQGTPKSLLQHHSSKVSILRRSAVFIVQKMIKKKKKISSLLKLKADQKTTVKGKTHDPPGRDIRGPPRLRCGYCRSDTKSLLLFHVKEQRPEPASWSHREHLMGNRHSACTENFNNEKESCSTFRKKR